MKKSRRTLSSVVFTVALAFTSAVFGQGQEGNEQKQPTTEKPETPLNPKNGKPAKVKPSPKVKIKVSAPNKVLTAEERQKIKKEAERLFQKLGAKEFETRNGAFNKLFKLGEPAYEVLLPHRDHKNPEVQWRARKLLTCIKWKIEPGLHAILGSPLDDFETMKWYERQRACLDLVIAGKEDVIPSMIEIIKKDPSPSVRGTAIARLYRLGEIGMAALIENGINVDNLGPYYVDIFISLGNRYLSDEKYDQAKKEYEKALKVDEKNNVAAYNMACVYSLKKEIDLAIVWLEKSICFGFNDFKWMKEDPDLNNLHGNPGYETILKRRGRPVEIKLKPGIEDTIPQSPKKAPEKSLSPKEVPEKPPLKE